MALDIKVFTPALTYYSDCSMAWLDSCPVWVSSDWEVLWEVDNTLLVFLSALILLE